MHFGNSDSGPTMAPSPVPAIREEKVVAFLTSTQIALLIVCISFVVIILAMFWYIRRKRRQLADATAPTAAPVFNRYGVSRVSDSRAH